MKPINEVLWMRELKDLEEQIQKRYDMIATMVGSVYPDMLRADITMIKLHIDWLKTL